MQIGYKLYEDLRDTNLKEFEALQLEMALTCERNGWCMEDGYDEDGKRYLIINPPVEPAPPTEVEIQKQLENGIEAWMNAIVRQRNYKDIVSACSYAASTDETFAKEGQACLAWRDKVWRKCYDILAEVKAGTRGIPTLEEVIAELPVLVW